MFYLNTLHLKFFSFDSEAFSYVLYMQRYLISHPCDFHSNPTLRPCLFGAVQTLLSSMVLLRCDDNEKTHVLTFLWNLLYILLYFNVLNAIMCADFIKKGFKNCCNVSLFILDAYEPIWCHPYTHTHTHTKWVQLLLLSSLVQYAEL